MRGKAHSAVAVSHFSIIIPFTMGVALSLALYTEYAPRGVPFHAFALFCGIAMSITAFPVLARILEERRLTHTPLGSHGHHMRGRRQRASRRGASWPSSSRWTTAGGAAETLLAIVVLSAAFVLLMIAVVRPVLQRALHPDRMGDTLSKDRIAIVLAVLLASALTTPKYDRHPCTLRCLRRGGHHAGGGYVSRRAARAAESISSVLLLPLFFA